MKPVWTKDSLQIILMVTLLTLDRGMGCSPKNNNETNTIFPNYGPPGGNNNGTGSPNDPNAPDNPIPPNDPTDGPSNNNPAPQPNPPPDNPSPPGPPPPNNPPAAPSSGTDKDQCKNGGHVYIDKDFIKIPTHPGENCGFQFPILHDKDGDYIPPCGIPKSRGAEGNEAQDCEDTLKGVWTGGFHTAIFHDPGYPCSSCVLRILRWNITWDNDLSFPGGNYLWNFHLPDLSYQKCLCTKNGETMTHGCYDYGCAPLWNGEPLNVTCDKGVLTTFQTSSKGETFGFKGTVMKGEIFGELLERDNIRTWRGYFHRVK